MKNTRNSVRIAELLKDRRDYRAASLINRRNEIDSKLKAVEESIATLRKAAE